MATKKKKTYKQLKHLADKLFSFYIRQRGIDDFGNNYCITCGVQKPWKELQNGHYVTRNCMALRYDEQNCHPQCMGCNVFQKGRLDIYAIRLMELYGDKILNDLNSRRKSKKIAYAELEEIIEKYKEYRVVDK